MSTSQIALENKFKYLLEKFGYIVVSFIQGKSNFPEIYLKEIDTLLINIDIRLSKTSDKDKKLELTDLYHVVDKFRIFAIQALNLSDVATPIISSKIMPKKGSPPNFPIDIEQSSHRFENL